MDMGKNNFVSNLLGLLPAALGCFVLLAFPASVLVPLVKIWNGGGAGWPAGLLYLLGAGIAGWGLKKADKWPEHLVAWGVICVSFAVKAVVAWLVPHLPLNIDQSLFHHFATRIAADGYASETLSTLSSLYDYPLWAARIFPVHYLMERIFPVHALAWTKALNVAAATLILVLTYGLARRVLPPGKRKWAVFLMAVLPFQTFWVTDYSHHLYSSLYLLAFTWAAEELAFGGGGLFRRMGLSSLAALCLLFMAWQGGVDWIAMGLAVGFVVVHAAKSSNLRRTLGLALWLLVIPAVAATMLKGPLLLNRIGECDVHRQNSVLPAFMARGWNPETGGEYCPRYEKLDMATPPPKKAEAMFRIVLSQMRHEPMKTCLWLPCVKTAKLFLVGYASNLEESLALGRFPALPGVGWIRRCGTAVFLGFVLLGCFRLAGLRDLPDTWVPVLMVPLLTWGAYVLAGETSPRYSVFCQPFLAVVGACAVRGAAETQYPSRPARWWWRLVVVVVLLLVAAGTVAMAVRLIPSHAAYEDLRGNRDGESTREGPFRLFERTAVLPPGEESASLVWPIPGGATACSFYALECGGAMADAEVVVATGGGEALATVPLDGRALPEYVEVALPADIRELHVRVSRASSDTGKEGTFVFGYLLWSMP